MGSLLSKTNNPNTNGANLNTATNVKKATKDKKNNVPKSTNVRSNVTKANNVRSTAGTLKMSGTGCRGSKRNQLCDVMYADTKPYIPPITTGKVIKVYDGDTITIATYIHGLKQPYRFSIRLSGIDTPELRTANETEKEYAIIIRDKLSAKIMDKTVSVSNISTEKYGRILATVTLKDENQSINDWLLKNKYAVEYTGGSKQEFNARNFAVKVDKKKKK